MIALFTLFAIAVYIGIVWAVVKHRKTKRGKYIALAILILIPMGDEIVGRITLSYLCATEAGVKVYQTVELPAKYWDEHGKARFIQREGYLEFDESMLGNQFARKSSLQSRSIIFRVDRDSYQLVDTKTQSVFGEDVNFMYRGGWIARNFSVNNSAVGCSRYQVGYFTDVLKQVFRPISAK